MTQDFIMDDRNTVTFLIKLRDPNLKEYPNFTIDIFSSYLRILKYCGYHPCPTLNEKISEGKVNVLDNYSLPKDWSSRSFNDKVSKYSKSDLLSVISQQAPITSVSGPRTSF